MGQWVKLVSKCDPLSTLFPMSPVMSSNSNTSINYSIKTVSRLKLHHAKLHNIFWAYLRNDNMELNSHKCQFTLGDNHITELHYIAMHG